MLTALGHALLLIAVPVAVVLGVGVPMMRLTGRSAFRARRSVPESMPLNFRWRGYSAAAAAAYWRWLGTAGVAAERRFLIADMAYPLAYGGAMLASLHAGWTSLGRPGPLLLLAAPVALTVLADWIENAIHLDQLRRHCLGEPLEPGWIAVASRATAVKLVMFWFTAALIAAVATAVVVQGVLEG